MQIMLDFGPNNDQKSNVGAVCVAIQASATALGLVCEALPGVNILSSDPLGPSFQQKKRIFEIGP